MKINMKPVAVVFASVTASNALCTRTGASCCGALASSLPGQVFYPNSTAYDERIEAIWSATAQLHPWCFVLPEDTNDTSIVIQTLVANQCPFGIKSGGHAHFAGGNSIHDGVTIDFGYINTTIYDTDNKIASVPPGTPWQTVYEALEPYGVTVTGGRAGGVGTAGFITGGGNSFHSTSHGWACDNIKNFEVVLYNGTVINANIDENNDLWQALKGGSGNFGLVTRFDMYVIEFPDPENPNIWGGIAQYELSAADDLIDSYVDFTENNYLDKNSSTMLYWVYTHSSRSLMVQVAMDNTLNIAYPSAYDRYLNTTGIIDTSLRSAPMEEITAEFDAGQPDGLQNIWITSAYKNDARIIKYAADKHEELIAGTLAGLVSNDSALVTLCSAFPLTQAMIEHGNANGGNVMNLEEKSGGENGVLFLASLAINGSDNAAIALPIMRQWVDEVDAYATSLDINWDWQFLNYAHGAFQEPIATYATEKIRAASLKYDPDQVFQKLRKTGHKIPAEQ
ncbi:putative FAD binding domain-containing protein [Seiridium unicorne]|uniref:FAD binding domain-containing protein n=1 Tax=Seiridium unicorne TaxID=138068 RepID=A0ABR2V880_9PEZI